MSRRSINTSQWAAVDDRREWLLTHYAGSLACGCVDGTRTRRYHGLLTVAHRPPAERRLELAAVEVRLVDDNESWPLSTNRYHDCFFPDARDALYRFFAFPTCAEWVYTAGPAKVSYTVELTNTGTGVRLTWTVLGAPSGARLQLIPLLAMRDAHSALRAGQALFHRHASSNEPFRHTIVSASHGDFMELTLSHPAYWRSAPDWYYRFDYPIERERGLEDQEDLWTPGMMEIMLPVSGRVSLTATVQRDTNRVRRHPVHLSAPSSDGVNRALVQALNQFLMARDNGLSVVAGYPWFVDWGRDSMIVLRGILCLEGGVQIASRVLQTFAGAMRHGLLPNRYPDYGETPEYNTVDATLWFGVIVNQWMREKASRSFAEGILLPAMRQAYDAHMEGTLHGIRVDPTDGLLMAGDVNTQLTWMDARAYGTPVTPRYGKPIEIAALWIAFCESYARLERRVGSHRRAGDAIRVADRARASFFPTFWNQDLGWFDDCVFPDGTHDPALRPNQLIALGLQPALAPHREACNALSVIRQRLLTPVGLRTLDPAHPAYRGTYVGPPDVRDQAYHQGCVWPWLWGPWLDAVAVNEGRRAARREAIILEQVVQTELTRNGLGTLPEIYDGDAPHTPRGCFAQAWSVSETLRALCLYGAARPRYGKRRTDEVQ